MEESYQSFHWNSKKHNEKDTPVCIFWFSFFHVYLPCFKWMLNSFSGMSSVACNTYFRVRDEP